MKFTIAIAAAIASFCAGLARGAEAKTHHGMLKQCKDFSLEGLNGNKGRTMTLKATCRTVDSSLDLNTCFGWDPAGGNFIMPSSGGFTSFVTKCDNNHEGDDDFGNKFGCWGPWTSYSNDYYQFALDSHIGIGIDSHLTC